MNGAGEGLYDRDVELKAVGQVLDDAESVAARLLVVHGTAGSGRSALLAAAGRLARQRGFQVLSARAGYAGLDAPFGVLSRLFGEEPGPDCDRVLATLAGNGPVLLLVDDVQRADADSMRWLAAVPWRSERLPVAVVAAVCTGEPSPEPACLDELAAACALELRLGPLGTEGCASLLAAALDAAPHPDFVSAAMRLTGGNPTALRALATVAAAAGTAPTAEAAATLSSLDFSPVAPALRARVRRISPEAWTLTRTLAVLGDGVDVSQIATVTGEEVAPLAEAARALMRLGVLREGTDGLGFAQPIVPAALVGELSFATLQSLHGQAARLMWESGAGPAQVAAHLVQTGPVGEPWALQSLRTAAWDARHAPGDAALYLRRALAEPMDDEERAGLLTRLADLVGSTDVPAAAGYLGEAARLDPVPATRVQVAARFAQVLVLADQRPAAGHALAACRTVLEDAGAAGYAWAAAVRHAAVTTGEPPTGTDVEEPAVAGTDPAPAVCRQLAALRAVRETWSGRDRDRAVRYAEEALSSPPAGAEELDGYLGAIETLMHAGQPRRAHRYAERAMRAPGPQDRPLCLAAIRGTRSRTAAHLGDLGTAISDLRTALGLLARARAHEHNPVSTRYRAHLATLLVEQRRLEEAAGLLLPNPAGYGQPDRLETADLLLARGRLWAATGDHEAAVADYAACGRLLETWALTNPAVLPWRSHAARSLAVTGELDEAVRHAEDEVRLARRWGAPAAVGRALHAYGVVRGGTEGLARLTEAVRVLEGADAPLDLARASADLGTALHRVGQRSAARGHLRAALKVAQQSQVPALAEHIQAELVAAGGRLHRLPQNGVQSLTRSEHNIALMALAGKTNREIAQRLYLRQRTVEIHLTNAYRKLGISGRAQLAHAFGAGGAFPSP